MMKLLSSKIAIGRPDAHLVWCPACNELHNFFVNRPAKDNGAQWEWNGDISKPTFSPSLVWEVRGENPRKCHSFLRDGVWEFLNDCTHDLAGQKVPLPNLPAWVIRQGIDDGNKA